MRALDEHAKVDLDLVQKYNVADALHAYPPATKFTDALVAWSCRAHSRKQQDGRSLGLLSHSILRDALLVLWLHHRHHTQHSQGQTYINYLEKEVAQMSTLLNPRRKAVQLHWGGGSPTFLSPDEIRKLGDIIHKHFIFSDDIEAGVEIDPRRLTRDHVVALREIGFNRASLGVQDFDPAVHKPCIAFRAR